MDLGVSQHTFLEEMRMAAERWPDVPFLSLTDHTGSVTRQEFLAGSADLGRQLVRLGVTPGDRVATLLDNGIEILLSLFACLMSGAIWVPLNTALTGRTLAHPIRETRPTLLITDENLIAQYRRIESALEHPPTAVTFAQKTTRELRAEAMLTPSRGATSMPELPHLDHLPNRPAAIMYTSGTTGRAKGVTMPQNQMFAMSETPRWVMGYTAEDVLYGCLPSFHGNVLFTTILPGFLSGSRVTLAPRFSASRFWSDVVTAGATALSLLGSMIPILWRRERTEDERRHSVRLALVIPRPSKYLDQFENRFGIDTTELYGLTDAGNVLAVPPGEDRRGACGKVVSSWEAQLVNDDDSPVPDGQVGELVLRPRHPSITQLGYWGREDATVEAWRNLWMHTGDYLRRDSHGWFYFEHRAHDVVRRFGENISATEVEETLLEHPMVQEVAVFAVPSDLAEDEVMAAVVLKPGTRPDPSSLVDHCQASLPYFAVPRYFDFVPSIPKTSTEKVQRAVLRNRGVTNSTWDRGPTGKKRRDNDS